MGICTSCCGGSSEEANLMPSPETRRKQLAEAAEKRRFENERKGIKDPERFKRQQQRNDELQKREEQAARMGTAGEPTLKWQHN